MSNKEIYNISDDQKVSYVGVEFSKLQFDDVLNYVFSECRMDDFKYVVTPNVQHAVAASDSKEFLTLLNSAWLCLCDSRILRRLAKLTKGIDLPLVTGSDLTAAIFDRLSSEKLKVAIIGVAYEDLALLQARYGELDISYFEAPMGLEFSAEKRRACVDFVLEEDADLVFIAVGAPRQEMIAIEVQEAGGRGVGLCIGASIDFLVGRQTRAPKWM